MTPFWGKSPQPGPTYFYSKETNYVHIIILHALGDKAGPTRFPRCHYFIRTQECAGSKDCNDTVFTILDTLAWSRPPKCAQPLLYRPGFDKDGRILGEAAAAAEGGAEGARTMAPMLPVRAACPQPNMCCQNRVESCASQVE